MLFLISWKCLACSLLVGNELEGGSMKQNITVFAVIQMMLGLPWWGDYWEWKLLMYGLIYMSTLSYSHKLLLVTKRTKLGNKQLMLKCLHWDCCICDPDLDKRQRMDGQNFSSSLITSLFLSQLHTMCRSDSRPPSYGADGPQIICCGLDCHQNMAEIFSFSNL